MTKILGAVHPAPLHTLLFGSPCGNPANRAMVYCVGPEGDQAEDAADFIHAGLISPSETKDKLWVENECMISAVAKCPLCHPLICPRSNPAVFRWHCLPAPLPPPSRPSPELSHALSSPCRACPLLPRELTHACIFEQHAHTCAYVVMQRQFRNARVLYACAVRETGSNLYRAVFLYNQTIQQKASRPTEASPMKHDKHGTHEPGQPAEQASSSQKATRSPASSPKADVNLTGTDKSRRSPTDASLIRFLRVCLVRRPIPAAPEPAIQLLTRCAAFGFCPCARGA